MEQSIWIPCPDRLVTLRATGNGDMGDVTDEESGARFRLDTFEQDGITYEVDVWTFVGCRAQFTSGTGSATMALRVDHRDKSGLYDWTLQQWASAGTGGIADIAHRVSALEDLFALYTFFAGDELVFEWTNPDSGTMRWAVELFLCAVRLRGA